MLRRSRCVQIFLSKTAEPVSRDQILIREEKNIFPVQPTKGRFDNLTRLILTMYQVYGTVFKVMTFNAY